MKLWLTKLRISSALDAGRPLAESLRRKIAADPELAEFVQRTDTLASRLRRPQSTVPDLHDGIMRAVRASVPPPSPRRRFSPAWLAAPIGIAAVFVLGLLMGRPHPAPPAKMSFNAPLAILDMSETIPATVPPAMMAPLTSEWAKVNHDVQSTRDIVASTFPF